jgi:hypothetical protein
MATDGELAVGVAVIAVGVVAVGAIVYASYRVVSAVVRTSYRITKRFFDHESDAGTSFPRHNNWHSVRQSAENELRAMSYEDRQRLSVFYNCDVDGWYVGDWREERVHFEDYSNPRYNYDSEKKRHAC